ncbi:MAG: CPBP family intramembrane metalloprotease [Anaerolineaceae bacterium]|nr:CPBP family intramembrane metalloprotease [Anaerolineaceae bacterium]
MNKLKTTILKYPIISAIVIMLIGTTLTEIHLEDNVLSWMDNQKASYLTGIIEQGGVSILLMLLLAWLGMLKQAGFTKPSEWKQVWLNWPILVFFLINTDFSVLGGTNPIDFSKPDLIFLFFLLYLAVGFIEEILFRGVMLPLMLRKWGATRKGIYWTVIFSSAIFGVIHIFNLIMGRYTLLASITQIIVGTCFGVYFAACFLRNRSIWPVIITHALFDIGANFTKIAVDSNFGVVHQTTMTNSIISILISLPMLIYGLILLRKVQPGQWQEPALPMDTPSILVSGK